MADQPEWYIVVDDEQVGPITASEIQDYINAGRFTLDGYVWKDGLADWASLQDVAELRALIVVPGGASDVDATAYEDNEATVISNDYHGGGQGDLASDVGVYGGTGYGSDEYVGGSYASDAQASDPYASGAGYQSSYDAGAYQSSDVQETQYQGGSYASAASLQDSSAGYQQDSSYQSAASYQSAGYGEASYESVANPYASPAESSPRASGGGLFAAFDNQSSNAGNQSGLVGQRNESSVLFSLSSLQQVASQTSGPAQSSNSSVTEGSGLIDLQALASAHDALGSGADTSDDPFGQTNMSLPPLAPMGSHKSNTPLIIGLTIGGILLLGLIAVVVVLLMNQNKVEQQPVAAAPAQKEVIIREVIREADPSAKSEAEKAAAAAKETAEKQEAEPEEPEEEADEPEEKSGRKRDRGSRSARPSSPSKSAPSRDSDSGRKRGSSKKDGIDALLNKMDKKDDGGSKSRGGGGGSKSSGLSRSQVLSTIRRYVPRVSTCGKAQNKGKLSGKMNIKFEIRPNGSVTGASVASPQFRGTDVGNCALKVVGAMKFPSSNASENLPITFPFTI